MQRNSMAEKAKVTWDGVEIAGLVSVGEITLEKSTIEVPSFHRVRQIQSGITKLPVIEMVYRIDRDSATMKFWDDFYLNDESHDATLIRCDASGSEFARKLLQGCECIKISQAQYNAASPEFAKVTVSIIPWDIQIVEAE